MRRVRAVVSALLIPVALAASAAADAPTRVDVPGTRVSLPLPEGFSLSDEFAGIGREEALTSVLVAELPAPFSRSLRDLAPEALARGGVVLHRATDVEVDGHRGRLLHAIQRVGDATFRKWILLLGDDAASVLVTATTPLESEAAQADTLVSVLRGVRWDPARAVDAGGPLPFRIGEVPPLRVMRASPNAVVLSDPDHDAGDGAVPPLVRAGSSLNRVRIADLERFAEERLRETVLFDEIEIGSNEPATLGGLPARRIEARARDVGSGRPVRVLHLLAGDGSRYYLLQGMVDAERAEGFEALFEAVAERFELAPAS